MGNVQLGIPERVALALKEASGAIRFIETGTYKGGTTLWAARHFEQVVTIEGYRPRYEKTVAHLLAHHADEVKNVRFIFGDSRDALRRVLTEEMGLGRTLMWLDAHWCGEGAEDAHERRDECPLMEELDALLDYGSSFDPVLIDDARLFLAPPPYPHDEKQWPTYAQISDKLHSRQSWLGGYVCHQDDVIYYVSEKHKATLHSALARESMGRLVPPG